MLQKISSFQQVTAAEYNKLVDAVNKLLSASAAPPLELRFFDGQPQFRVTERGFWAKVTSVACQYNCGSSSSSASSSPASYRWKYGVSEVSQQANGQWAVTAGGRTPASVWEVNDAQVTAGQVVWVEPFGDDDWRFDHAWGPKCQKVITDWQCVSGTPTVTYKYLYGNFIVQDLP